MKISGSFIPQSSYVPLELKGSTRSTSDKLGDLLSFSKPIQKIDEEALLDEPFTKLLESYDFKILETLPRMLGLFKRSSDLGRLYLNSKTSDTLHSKLENDLAGKGDGQGVEHFRQAMRVGGSIALAEAFRRDPAGYLNLLRKFATGSSKLYKPILTPDVLEVYESSFEVVVGSYVEICKELIPLLEERVQAREVLKEIQSYGVELGDGCETIGAKPPSCPIDSKPREFLGAWGSLYLRMAKASERLFELGKVSKAHADEYAKGLNQELVDKICAISIPSPELETQAKIALVFAGQWVMAGLPVIAPSHKLAASLMSTHVPEELVPEVAIPWDAFLVEVPEGILEPSEDHAIDLSKVGYVGLARGELVDGGSMLAVFFFRRDRARPFWIDIQSVRDLANLNAFGDLPLSGRSLEIDRGITVLGRLLLGALIELDDPAHKGRVARGAPQSAIDANHRSGKVPAAWVFQLLREVKVDARPYVREYVAVGSRSLKVQSFVRGHSKRQRYGPQGSLRKWITIEPYWKGENDAPVALRRHRIGHD